ncbi:MAG: RNA polymerase factor sigma-32 [Myxococcales bacterium]|nr:RNA polymerase factor sigma-32 [Myxococcales bacterium]
MRRPRFDVYLSPPLGVFRAERLQEHRSVATSKRSGSKSSSSRGGSDSPSKTEAQPRAESDERESNDEGDDGDDNVLVGEVADGDSLAADEGSESSLAKIAREDSEKGLRKFDPFATYFREIARHKLLTPEEENSLAVRYVQTGDVKAASRLVTSNLRLVVKIAYEYRRAYRNMMDLVQEGNIGLMQAVKRYDPYRGVKLSSYAAWWIRAYILRFILNNWRLVKLGTTQAQRKLFFNLNKEKQRLLAQGINPDASEIARRLDVTENEVNEMDRRLSSGDASLDAPIGDADGKPLTRLDLLPSGMEPQDETVGSAELSGMLKEKLDRFRATLQGKELTIYDERLVAEDPKTLQEIGDHYGISRERVRQLEARLQGKLKKFLQEEMGAAIQFR